MGGPQSRTPALDSFDEARYVVTTFPHSSPAITGLQTRLVVETLVQVVPGTEIVAIVAESVDAIVGVDLESFSAPGSEDALAHSQKRVPTQFGGDAPIGSVS